MNNLCGSKYFSWKNAQMYRIKKNFNSIIYVALCLIFHQ